MCYGKFPDLGCFYGRRKIQSRNMKCDQHVYEPEENMERRSVKVRKHRRKIRQNFCKVWD